MGYSSWMETGRLALAAMATAALYRMSGPGGNTPIRRYADATGTPGLLNERRPQPGINSREGDCASVAGYPAACFNRLSDDGSGGAASSASSPIVANTHLNLTIDTV